MITDHENWQENADENQNANSENENAKESRYAHVGSFDGNASDEQRPHRPTFTRAAGGSRGDRPQRPRFSRPAPANSERVTFGNRDERPSYGSSREYGERQDRRNSYGSYNREEGGERRPYRPAYNREEGDSYNSYGSNGYNNNRGGYNRNNGGGYGNNYGNDGGQRPRFNNQGGGYGNRRPQPQQGGGFRPRKGAPGAYNPNAKYSKKKQIEYKEEFVDPNEPIRLNKYLANAGVCSRREADEFITAGVVTVNGEVVNELGTKVKRGDQVTCNGQPVSIERKIYILLNKPKDCVTTSDDPQERKTVMDYVKGACTERIYPVGRLDRNTTGVLLLTNDGDLASKLTHPKFLKKKIYHVRLDKNLTKADMDQIAAGITLDDGEIHADEISYVTEDKSDIGIEIHSGKNRIVRRIFESLGYRVVKLDRVFFAGLTKKALRRGQWRFLTEKEVNMLRMGAFE